MGLKTKIAVGMGATALSGVFILNTKPVECALNNKILEDYGNLYALTGGQIMRGYPIDQPTQHWSSDDSLEDVFLYAQEVALDSLDSIEIEQCENTTSYTDENFQKSVSDLKPQQAVNSIK